jgi:hypothetical protein
MNRQIKIILYGFLTWLIPFITAFLFYTKEGELTIDLFLFKSIMIVAGSAAGALLLILYFRKIEKNYLREGITVGLAWLTINIILDLIILIPMSRMNTGAYFAEIGLRYLTIPITSTAIGYVAENKAK